MQCKKAEKLQRGINKAKVLDDFDENIVDEDDDSIEIILVRISKRKEKKGTKKIPRTN